MSQLSCSESAALRTSMSFTDVAIKKLRFQGHILRYVFESNISSFSLLYLFSPSHYSVLYRTLSSLISLSVVAVSLQDVYFEVRWFAMQVCGTATDIFVTVVSEHPASSLFSQKRSICNHHLISSKSNREAYAGFLLFHLCRVELSKSKLFHQNVPYTAFIKFHFCPLRMCGET